MRNHLTANAAPIGCGRPRRRRAVRSGLLALPLALALIAPGATAFAVEPTTSYGQKTPAPKTETTPTTQEPKSGAAPTQTSSTPSHETVPTKTSEPTATTAKAKTLPFTGLDLRWITIGGLLLVGMGTSIMVVQRRRHGTGR